LRGRHPDWWILLSTSHPRAFELARSHPDGADAVCRLPWDSRHCVERALNRARPDLLILVECELWPNLIARAVRQSVRILMLNARIYERDVWRYHCGRGLFKPLLRRLSWISAQSEEDRARFLVLGASPQNVYVGGNTKFDVGVPPNLEARMAGLRAVLPLGAGPLWVLASTHEDEEAQILARCQPLESIFPGLQLLIAPRHAERAEAIRQTAERFGLSAVLRTRLAEAGRRRANDAGPAVIILDTIGELPVALGLADLVFVGGSLVARGGHNPIEAAVHGKTILLGPSDFNFREIVAAFLSARAAVRVLNAQELVARAGELLANPALCRQLGGRAADLVRRHAGAAARFVRVLEQTAAQPWENAPVLGSRIGPRVGSPRVGRLPSAHLPAPGRVADPSS
jgi:3-deoxy-D-manno-octulosonic-acid transferase